MLDFPAFQTRWGSVVSTGALLLLSAASAATAGRDLAPDLMDIRLDVAETIAVEAGIELSVERVQSRQRPGVIIAQFPGGGTMLGADRRVTLHVSDGLIVPDLLGMTRATAEAELERLGLAWEVTERPVRQVAAGLIGDLIPPSETRIDPTRHVVFVVVSNMAVALIPHDIIGRPPSEVERALNEAGLTVSYDKQIRKSIFDMCTGMTTFSYTVIGSLPSPGTDVPLGGNVKVNLEESQFYSPTGPCSEGGIAY